MGIPPRTLTIAILLGILFTLPLILAATPLENREVYVTASFTNEDSLFIEDLRPDEVQILENDKPQKIELLLREEIPTIYGLLFDRSLLGEDHSVGSSYRPEIPSAATAARDMAFDLIDRYLRGNRMWIASYDKTFHFAVMSTTDGFAAKDAIHQMSLSSPADEVFAYSGIYSAVMEMNKCSEKRRVIILLLDTLDQESLGKIPQLQNILSMSNVELISISFASRLSTRSGIPAEMNRAALAKLAQATSGEAYFSADSGGHPEDLVRQIYNRIRTLYTLGFESDAPTETKTKLLILCTRSGSRVRHHAFIPVLSFP
jgi:hypothetical protein